MDTWNGSWRVCRPNTRQERDASSSKRCARDVAGPAHNLRFTLLLDEVGQKLEPAYDLKDRWLAGKVEVNRLPAEKQAARTVLRAAPIEQLFQTCAGRVCSRGEFGVANTLHQKLWLQYRELKQFLESS